MPELPDVVVYAERPTALLQGRTLDRVRLLSAFVLRTVEPPLEAAHGRFRLPCPACGTPIQRVVWAEHEMHYCPTCQTGGEVLSDRGLARLFGASWEGWSLKDD